MKNFFKVTPFLKKSILSAENLRKIYSKKIIVDKVNISLKQGEVVGLLGPNGAGKTTCFFMISGIVAPSFGKIKLDGQDITVLPMYKRARLGIGYLPQESSIFRGLNVEDNIRTILEIVLPDKKNIDKTLESLLSEFMITHLRKSPALTLSGGERRRVEIARALAANPKFILLDEPFAGIDPIAMKDIRKLILYLKSKKIGILITDHNVRETLSIVDRAYIISDGKIIKEGNPKEIIINKEVKKHYLGEDFVMNKLNKP